MGEFDDILGPDNTESKPSSGSKKSKFSDLIESYDKAQKRWIEEKRKEELEEIKKWEEKIKKRKAEV